MSLAMERDARDTLARLFIDLKPHTPGRDPRPGLAADLSSLRSVHPPLEPHGFDVLYHEERETRYQGREIEIDKQKKKVVDWSIRFHVVSSGIYIA
jgi:hypothetical protein